MSELKPCPCGSKKVYISIELSFFGIHKKVNCSKCSFNAHKKHWNTRTQSQCNEEIKKGVRVALRILGNADINEDIIKKFADDYVSSLPPKEQE